MAFIYRLSGLDGEELSELPLAHAKTLGLSIGSLATAGFTTRLDSADADTLLEGDTLLTVTETDVPGTTEPVLHFHGRQVAAQEVASEGAASVAASFADPYWLTLRRLIGKSASGYTRGTSLAPVDRGTIIHELLAAGNAEGTTRLRPGTLTPSSSTFVAGWYYKPLGEAIAELAATLDGPDWRVRPIPYSDGYIGELDVAPVIGTSRPDAVFEFGDGLANVKTYTRGVTLEGAANRMHSLPPGFPDNATQAVLTEDAAPDVMARRELLEAVLSTDLNVDELRRALLRHHIAVRANPRQTITFEPVAPIAADRVPRLGVDCNVGDVVPFRASVDRGLNPLTREPYKVKRINALMRVYGVAYTENEAGTMVPAFTVAPNA